MFKKCFYIFLWLCVLSTPVQPAEPVNAPAQTSASTIQRPF